MTVSIGNTSFAHLPGKTYSYSHNNDGDTIVVFLVNAAGGYSATNAAYGGESMEPELILRTSDCRGYAFILENAPSGSNNFTFTSAAQNWYISIYSLIDAGGEGDYNSDTVHQQGGSACRAPVDTQDTDSIVVASIIRRYTTATMTAQNMTEDNNTTYSDGRVASGHAQGTGGTVDLWWNWNSTENAVLLAVEVLYGAQAPPTPSDGESPAQASWFF